MGGEEFVMTDENILKINSPKPKKNKKNVGGPYTVVFKNKDERWAIVTMDWNEEPRIGMRWFWGSGGNPFSTRMPIWLVIPTSLSGAILNGLPLVFEYRKKIEKFLTKEISGVQLKG